MIPTRSTAAKSRRGFIKQGASAVAVGGVALARGPAMANPLPSPGPIVETAAGKVRGLVSAGVHAFRGIPYGGPTGGEARFRAPAAARPWSGVKEAIRVGPMCPQGGGGPFTPSPDFATLMTGASDGSETSGEDCLVLNVWTPGLEDRAGRPVMVWLHGGGFATGSGGIAFYDGENLARKRDVVVVTLNHRLNAFGFLYLAELGEERYADSGMAGMLDVAAALAWVRDNIAAFGGDPGNVTVFGESGGGAKVSTLMAMPAAKGLFHRAIVQSGPGLRMIPADSAHELAARLMSELGLRGDEVEALHKLPAAEILRAAAAAQRPGAGMGPGSFAPTVDGRNLPRHPFDPTAPDLSADVPLLIGANSHETTLMLGLLAPDGAALFELTEADMRRRVQAYLATDAAGVDRVVDAYRQARPDASPSDLFFRITSDRMLRMGSITLAERKAAQGAAPVYMYHFTWPSPGIGGKARATHTLEIPFVFENVDRVPVMTGSGANRLALADRMSAAWAAFARSGDPNCPELPPWPAYSAAERGTMIFDDACAVVKDPDREARLVLASFPPTRR